MGLLNRIEELEKELLELKEQAKEELFPQDEDKYWYVGMRGDVFSSEWEGLPSEEHMLEVGNIFKTEDEAYFKVERLKVENELRKLSQPFKSMTDNFIIVFDRETYKLGVKAVIFSDIQGAIYFDSTTVAEEAIESVGAERIKKYIFGMED